MLTHLSSVPSDFLLYRDCLPNNAPQPLIFLDIETMGLSHRRDPIILIGLMVIENGSGTLYQFFAQSPSEEKTMLEAFIACIPASGPIFTFNGRSFDIPYINHRLIHHGLDNQIPAPRCVDLMHWAKNAIPESPRHTLKTIEEQLGIQREDTLSGADCVRQYQTYLQSQERQLADDICLHNFEDILHLAPLLRLYALLPEKSPHREFPLCLPIQDHLYWFEPPACKKDFLALKGSTVRSGFGNVVCYCGSASLEIYRGDLAVTLPVMAFDYPVPGCLYLDCDRIPGYLPQPFNRLSTEEKLQLLVREGAQYLPAALTRAFAGLLSLS